MRWPVLVCLLAACDGGRPPSPQAPVAAPTPLPTATDAALPADAGVAVQTPTPDAPDAFQALFERPSAHVTKDGSLVLLAVVDADGARGEPNLVFEVRDRKDRTIERVVVLELDKPEPDAAEKHRRVAAVEKLFASREWVAMTMLAGDADHEGHFAGEGLTVDWANERMTITRATKAVVDRPVPAKWRGGSYFSKLDDLMCDNPDFLAAAFSAGEHPLVVVDVAYRGNDTCWEPTNALHVVSW